MIANPMIGWFKKNYFNFEGRASRKEFWLFFLGIFIFACAIATLSFFLEQREGENLRPIIFGIEIFTEYIFPLILIAPYLAVTIRRLHDTNRSGTWLILQFIPIVGQIWMIILLCIKGNQKTNKYGPSPYPLKTSPPPPINACSKSG